MQVHVTEQDIKEGIRGNGYRCPTASNVQQISRIQKKKKQQKNRMAKKHCKELI